MFNDILSESLSLFVRIEDFAKITKTHNDYESHYFAKKKKKKNEFIQSIMKNLKLTK